MTDQELQELVEKGKAVEDRDARAYQKVFVALCRDPDFVLSANFADRVVASIQARYSRRDMAWFIGGVLLFVVALVVAMLLTGFTFSLGVFTFLSGYPGLVAFGAAFVLTLHWVDRKWVRKPVL